MFYICKRQYVQTALAEIVERVSACVVHPSPRIDCDAQRTSMHFFWLYKKPICCTGGELN